MPLVTCPECRQQVSSAAPACPHCGHPMPAPGRAGPPGDPGPERDLWVGTPSAKALIGPIVGAALFAIVLPVGAYLLYDPLLSLFGRRSFVAENEGGVRLAVIAFVATVVAVRVLGLVWRVVVLKSYRYRITNQRILIESGVFSRRIEEIDMRTVEDLDFQQGFVERLLGIGDITVIGADKTTGRTRLQGLAKPRDLRELIRTSAYQATRGQLFTRQT
jgi:membrane protein YdbS with pleckstrin-like domain